MLNWNKPIFSKYHKKPVKKITRITIEKTRAAPIVQWSRITH